MLTWSILDPTKKIKKSLRRHVCCFSRSREMGAHRFGQKWEIGQKSPALTGPRKTDAAVPEKPFSSPRNKRFREDLEPITTNARGGAIRESRRTRGFRLRSCRPRPKGPLLLRTLWGCVHSHSFDRRTVDSSPYGGCLPWQWCGGLRPGRQKTTTR